MKTEAEIRLGKLEGQAAAMLVAIDALISMHPEKDVLRGALMLQLAETAATLLYGIRPDANIDSQMKGVDLVMQRLLRTNPQSQAPSSGPDLED